MKTALHKLLCALLVLTMVLGMMPAAFAADESTPPETGVTHDATHQLEYTSLNDGRHTVSCTVEGCDFVSSVVDCEYGDWTHVEGTFTHEHTCQKCGYKPQSEVCSKEYATREGSHLLFCSVCGEQYGSPEACKDEDKDCKCDDCGQDMPAAPADPAKVIVGFRTVRDITVKLGTQIKDIDLPKTVSAYTEDRKTVDCAVTWSCANYDASKKGDYTFTGTITLPDGYKLKDGVSSTITVKVTVGSGYSLDISARSTTVTIGDSLNLSATIKLGGTALVDTSGLSVEWSVEPTALASISTGRYSYLNNSTSAVLSAKACDSLRGSTVKVTAVLKSGKDVLATADTSVKIVPATASTIRVNATNGGVVFGESAFYSALGYTLAPSLDFVCFDLPSANKGVLYTDQTRYASKLTTASRCYYKPNYLSSVIDLDEVYFEVDDRFNGSTITLSYTSYNAAGYILATGSIEVTLTSATIRYTTDTQGKVTFDENDFRSALRSSYSGSTLSYVRFDMSQAVFGNSYSGSGKYGHLYVDSTLTTRLTESNDDSAIFVYNYRSSTATRYTYDLDDVTYVAGSATGKYTVTIPFTAYGTGNETVSGVVEIVVDETDVYTISYTGTNFRAVEKDIAATWTSATHVLFTLPEEGTLYYNYDAINSYSHKVRSSYGYYINSTSRDEYDLHNVYFVPAAGQTKATIRFDVYNGRTKLDSGSIVFSIKGKTASSVFTDVTYNNTGSWAADSVDFMNANGLIYGTGKNRFNPTGTMTRGDLVLILYRLSGRPSVSGVTNPFTDVSKSDYYYEAVLWAYANKIVNGSGRTTFSPKQDVTREQLAAILYRYSGSPTATGRLSSFTDTAKLNSYATSAMKWAVGAGIITGNGSRLDPQSSATRAQVATILHRYLTK